MNIGWKVGRRFVMMGAASGVGATMLPALAVASPASPAFNITEYNNKIPGYLFDQVDGIVKSFQFEIHDETAKRAICYRVGRFLSVWNWHITEPTIEFEEHDDATWVIVSFSYRGMGYIDYHYLSRKS